MADLGKPTEDSLDMNEAIDNKPEENGAEDGTSVDSGSPTDATNGPSKQINVDLLIGPGGDNNEQSELDNNEQPLVDLSFGLETKSQSQEEVDGSSHPSTEPLLDLSGGLDQSAEVQDPFGSSATNEQDSSSNQLIDVASAEPTADGEINSQQDLGTQPTADPDTQPAPLQDPGLNISAPGAEVNVNIDLNAEIKPQDLPGSQAANSQDRLDKDSLSTHSECAAVSGGIGNEGAVQDDPTDAGTTNDANENNSTTTQQRKQPVLDASKEKDKQRSHYKVQTRQERIDEIAQKNTQRRAAVEERKRKQLQEAQERKDALDRRSRERTENANVKRRSWSAYGPRDAPSPVLSASTPRGRSADRMADRTDRPSRPASASSNLGVNKRLSSSTSQVYRPVHLVRLGPNADDWFEVHLPVKAVNQAEDRRSSSPGTDKSSQRQPRHHQSSPNLASNTAKRRMRALYQPRDIKSAQSTPTHTPRPLSSTRASSNSRLSPSKTTDDIKKTEKKATAPKSTRPPSPRQRPASPAAPKARTPSGDRTDSAGKRTPGRSPSPRTHGRAADGADAKKPRTPGSRTPSSSGPPPIKKALTPTASVGKTTTNSPSRSSLRSSTKNTSSPSTTKPTTPRRDGSKKEPSKKEPSKKEPMTAKKDPAPIKKSPAPIKKEETQPEKKEEAELSPKEPEASQPAVEVAAYKPHEKTVAYEDIIIEESSVEISSEEGGEAAATETEATTDTPETIPETSETKPEDITVEEKDSQPTHTPAEKAQEAAIPVEAVKTAIPAEIVKAATPAETVKAVIPTKEPPTEEPQVNGTTPVEKPKEAPPPPPPAKIQAPPKDPKDMTDEERAKAALAERRREAREKAEREAELERQRQEQLKREEEEREKREEEERIRQEEEDRIAAEEHRKAEEERLQRAIEDNKREQERKEEEAKQKEEEDKKRQEDIAKKEEEIQEKLAKEDEERNARKKRVSEIMMRARRGAQATGGDGSEGSTSPNDPTSDPASDPTSEPKTNGLSSSSILNNEKYKNLLNRSQLSGEEDNGDDGEGGATTNGKVMQNDSISDEKEMVDGDNAADTGDEVEDTLTTNNPEGEVDKDNVMQPPVYDQGVEEPPSSEIYKSSSKVVRPLDEDLSSSETSTPSPSSASSPSFTVPRGVDNVNERSLVSDGNANGGDSGLSTDGLSVDLNLGMKNANNDELNANLMQTTGANSGPTSQEEGVENAPGVGVNLSFSLDGGVTQQQASTMPEELAADAV